MFVKVTLHEANTVLVERNFQNILYMKDVQFQ
jgi:hypothetical protein